MNFSFQTFNIGARVQRRDEPSIKGTVIALLQPAPSLIGSARSPKMHVHIDGEPSLAVIETPVVLWEPLSVAQDQRRVADLLEANNRYLERARAAEAELAALKVQIADPATPKEALAFADEIERGDFLVCVRVEDSVELEPVHAKTLMRLVACLRGQKTEPGMVAITTNGRTRLIPADEPVFLIRGQDVVGGAIVRAWASLASDYGADEKIVQSAREHAAKMDAWPTKKIPDLPPAAQDGGVPADPKRALALLRDTSPAMKARIEAIVADIQARLDVGNSPAVDMVAILRRQAVFSARAFGPHQNHVGVLKHIRKELVEIEADPGDVEEWIDVATLAFDGARRCAGASPVQIAAAFLAKMEKNEARDWPDWRTVPPGEPVEHIRSAEPVAFADTDPEARFIADGITACQACGGSGHIDDAKTLVIPDAVAGRMRGSTAEMAAADRVVTESGRVLKDRDGPLTFVKTGSMGKTEALLDIRPDWHRGYASGRSDALREMIPPGYRMMPADAFVSMKEAGAAVIERYKGSRFSRDLASAIWTAMADAAPDMLPVKLPRVRHQKRGTTYTVLGEAEAQVSAGAFKGDAVDGSGEVFGRHLFEGRKLVVYRSEADGKLWLRFPDEMADGRFVDISGQEGADA